jgi:hypothetical protein
MARMNQIVAFAVKAISGDVIRMVTCGSFASTLDLNMKRCHQRTTLFLVVEMKRPARLPWPVFEQLK